MGPVTVVLDLDGVFVDNTAEPSEALFLLRKGLVVEAGATNYVFSGTIELLQRLVKEEVRIAFFSSGAAERNVPLVRQLFEKAFGETPPYESVVLSKKDLTPRQKAAGYGMPYGNNKKDISKALQKGAAIEDAVLVEDDLSYVEVGQEKNVFYVPKTKSSHFSPVEQEGECNFKMNRIFYLTGLFFQVLEQARQEKISLSEALFRRQFKLVQGEYWCQFHELSRDRELYDLGLAKLREVDPALQFTSSLSIRECLKIGATKEEQKVLNQYRPKGVGDYCCIQ